MTELRPSMHGHRPLSFFFTNKNPAAVDEMRWSCHVSGLSETILCFEEVMNQAGDRWHNPRVSKEVVQRLWFYSIPQLLTYSGLLDLQYRIV